MGDRGPQRKPTAALALSGSTRGKARAATEPKIGYSIPEPPPWLSAGAALYWPYVCDQVAHLRCITDSDRTQLAVFAQSLKDYIDTVKDIEANGPTLESTKTGAEYPSPALNRQSSIYTRLKDCMDRFGLNPSNRSKVVELAPKLGVIEPMVKKPSRFAD